MPDGSLRATETRIDVALAIVIHPAGDRVLIARRPSGVHLSGFWEFPGGKVEPGEAPAHTAVRECLEETGIAVAVREAWPPLDFDYPDRSVKLHPFLCDTAEGQIEPHQSRPGGGRETVWVTRASLASFKFPAANSTLLKRLYDHWD
ncbi:MAG: (deoxy)nucleoside triphosphate pyrophosphohydrolase [Capsulimonadaceae bacterium]